MNVTPRAPEQTNRSVRNLGAAPRAAILAYGATSYAVGVSALLGLILATLGVLDLGGGPVRIERPALAALLNLGLLAAFGVQHSVMARPAFKQRWTRVIHPSIERSTFVLATGAVLLPLLALWQPLPTAVWSVGSPVARGVVTGLAVLGWAYLFAASLAIDHFELFGLQQVWRAYHGMGPATPPFRERWMYRFDRHPIMTGLLVGVWATPEMTQGHLLLAAGLSVYVVIGVHFEERSLRRQWGEVYEDYRRRVGTIVPLPWSGQAQRGSTVASPPLERGTGS